MSTALRKDISREVVGTIDREIREAELQLDLLRKIRQLAAPDERVQPVAAVVKRKIAKPGDTPKKVLAVMSRNGQPDFSVRELAEKVKLSPGAITGAVNQLVESGAIVEVGLRQRRGKPGRTYALVAQ